MKISSILLFAGMMVLAFSAGYFCGSPGQNIGIPPVEMPQRSLQNSSQQDRLPGLDSSSDSALISIDPMTMRSRAFAILSITHDVERMRAFCDLLPSVSAANWRQTLDAFRAQEKSDGRFRDAEFQFLLDQIARVDSKNGVSEIVFSKDLELSRRSYRFLKSWASSDPAQAVAWIETQDSTIRDAYLPPLVSGLAESEPARARPLLYAAPAGTYDSSLGTFVDGMVAARGFRSAEEFYDSVRSDPQAPPQLVKELYYKLSNARVSIAQAQNDAPGLLAWADRDFPAGRSQGVGILTSAARMDGPRTLSWLDARRERLSKEDADFLCGAVAVEWQSHRPQEAVQWLSAHANHPQRDTMAVAIAIARTHDSNIPQAQAAIATITDPQRRSAAISKVLQVAPQFRRE
jgi:hypothetical protein